MSDSDVNNISLMKLLNYKFKDLTLLEKARTTSAYIKQFDYESLDHNEHLEKVGDSVIGLLACEKGYYENPSYSLHIYKSKIVENFNLAKIFNKIHLYIFFKWSKGQLKDKQWEESDKLKGNCIEALIGAIYIDGGFEKAKTVFWKLLEYLD